MKENKNTKTEGINAEENKDTKTEGINVEENKDTKTENLNANVINEVTNKIFHFLGTFKSVVSAVEGALALMLASERMNKYLIDAETGIDEQAIEEMHKIIKNEVIKEKENEKN